MNPLNLPIANSGLPDTLNAHKRDIVFGLNVAMPGKIVSFDIAKKTASIQILFKAQVLDAQGNPKIISYPKLLDCPVVTVQGGGAYLQMPIAAGDHCLVIFSDRNLDLWFQNGAEALPADNRSHDLSDGIAIVGLSPQTSTLPSYSTTEARLVFGNAKVGISGGRVTITNGTTTLLAALDGLIDVMKALTVASAPIDASGIAALEAYKAIVATVLY